MKNKALEPKTDPQPSLSPYQAEPAEAQETRGLQPDPLGGALAAPGGEATLRADAANLNRTTAGRTLRRLQRQCGNRYVQRVVELVQRRGSGEGFQLDDETAGRINRARGGGQPLDGAVQAQMSEALGFDFSGVRVHTDSEADALNQELCAKAFTTGQDIFFRQGEYSPSTGGGRELMAHELSHVVQQSTGPVSGGASGMSVRPAGDAFEQEADARASKAAKEGGGGAARDGQVVHRRRFPEGGAHSTACLRPIHRSTVGASTDRRASKSAMTQIQRQVEVTEVPEAKEYQVKNPAVDTKAQAYVGVQHQGEGGSLSSTGYANCVGVAATNGTWALVAHSLATWAEPAAKAIKKLMDEKGGTWKGEVVFGNVDPIEYPSQYNNAKKGAEVLSGKLSLGSPQSNIETVRVAKCSVEATPYPPPGKLLARPRVRSLGR